MSKDSSKLDTSDLVDFRIDQVVSSNVKLTNHEPDVVVAPENPQLVELSDVKSTIPEPDVLGPNVHQSSPSASQAQPKFQFRKPPKGLKNMGNTCYANAILTCFFSFPELWDFPSSSPFLQSLKVVLVAMNSATASFAPKPFLISLKKHITGLQSHAFRYNQQHDASEVLVYVLQEVQKITTRSPQLVSSVLVPWYSCQSCNTRAEGQDLRRPESVLNLQVSESVSASVQHLLAGGELLRYCQKCKRDQMCTEERIFDLLPNGLILWLLRDQFDTNLGMV